MIGKKEDKTEDRMSIHNNCFVGVIWEAEATEAVLLTARALLNLTELFRAQNIHIDALLQINDSGEKPSKEIDE